MRSLGRMELQETGLRNASERRRNSGIWIIMSSQRAKSKQKALPLRTAITDSPDKKPDTFSFLRQEGTSLVKGRRVNISCEWLLLSCSEWIIDSSRPKLSWHPRPAVIHSCSRLTGSTASQRQIELNQINTGALNSTSINTVQPE